MPTNSATVANPYGERRSRPGEAPGINTGSGVYYSRYAVKDIPESTDPEYQDGYATELDPTYESGTTPDPIRTGQQEPPINDPNVRAYNKRRFRDYFKRISDANEETTTGWDVKQSKVPPGQNPMWTDERMPVRPTATSAPMGHMFTRDWHIPRFLHDIDPSITNHISMADHRRQYEIFGMRTRDRVGVNTFRLDPQPWDQGLYPPDQTAAFSPPDTGAQSGSRSYRLG